MISNLQDITKSALWSVSTTKAGYEIGAMFDGHSDTFWQSDSIPPHFIMAQFPKKTYLTKLSLHINIQLDETYTPVEIILHVGDDPNILTELRKEAISLENQSAWIDIPLDVSTIFLKIEISKNLQGGKDTRIRQIKLWGGPQSYCVDSSVFFVTPNATQFLTLR